jgi:hypothetical protein
METEPIRVDGKRMMTIRLDASPQMKKVLGEYCGATRYFYNKALGISRKAKKPDGGVDYSVAYNKKYLKNELIYRKQMNGWEKNIPSHIRQEAVNDLIKNKDSALALWKAGHCKHFELRFKSRKENKDYFRARKQGIKVINVDGKVALEFYPAKTRSLIKKRFGCSLREARDLAVVKTGIPWNEDRPWVVDGDSTVCCNRRTQQYWLYTPVPYTPPQTVATHADRSRFKTPSASGGH